MTLTYLSEDSLTSASSNMQTLCFSSITSSYLTVGEQMDIYGLFKKKMDIHELIDPSNCKGDTYIDL